MKKTLTCLLVTILIGINGVLPVFAQTPNDYEIIPKATTDVSTAVKAV